MLALLLLQTGTPGLPENGPGLHLSGCELHLPGRQSIPFMKTPNLRRTGLGFICYIQESSSQRFSFVSISASISPMRREASCS